MHEIAIHQNNPITSMQVKHLKKITFEELPDMNFIIFQEPDKTWNITETEFGLKIAENNNAKLAKKYVTDNAEMILKRITEIKKEPPKVLKKIPLIETK